MGTIQYPNDFTTDIMIVSMNILWILTMNIINSSGIGIH